MATLRASTSVIHVETDLLWRRTRLAQKCLYPTYFKICRRGGMSSQISCPRFGPAPYYRPMQTVEDASEKGRDPIPYRYQPISRPIFLHADPFQSLVLCFGTRYVSRIGGVSKLGLLSRPVVSEVY